MGRAFAAVAVVLCLAACALGQTAETVYPALFTSLGTTNGITGMAYATVDTAGVLTPQSGSYGKQDVAGSRPMWPDTAVRGNSVGEMLITLAALKLIKSGHLPALDAAITPALLPQSIALINPSSASTPVTLRMLMTHTSTLTDSTKFQTYSKTAPAAVQELRAFVQDFLLVASGSTFALATNIFTTGIPGTAAAFHYARINNAVLTYVVGSAVIATPALVNSATKTAMAYVQEVILAPLGMSNTFVAGLTGVFPSTTYPAGTVVYTGNAAVTRTAAGANTALVPLHPAFYAEDMLQTTAADLGRLAQSLFLGGANAEFGTAMTASRLVVTTGSTGQTAQGLGVLFYDGAEICAQTINTGKAVTKCPFTSGSNVWGYIATGSFSQVAIMCTDNAARATCVTSALSFDQAATAKPAGASMSVAGTALQLSVGDTSTISFTDTSSRDNVRFGFGIAFAALGTIVFVVIAAFVTEIVIQPAPPAAGVTVPGMAPPPKPDN